MMKMSNRLKSRNNLMKINKKMLNKIKIIKN